MNTWLQRHLYEISMTYECGMDNEKEIEKNLNKTVKVLK